MAEAGNRLLGWWLGGTRLLQESLLWRPIATKKHTCDVRNIMGDIGVPELLIILAIAIIVFGPSRMAGLGKSLGEAIRNFRQATREEDTRAPASEEQSSQPYTTDEQSRLRESPSAGE
jgi:sec-independent protein translocase protein TatA